MEAKFLSRSSMYTGDYECLYRSQHNEMKSGLHYHDFYEVVIYLGNAGVFKINGMEYLVRRGDIALINMFDAHTLKYNRNTDYERFSICIDPSLLLSFNTGTANLLDIFNKNNRNYPILHVEGKCLDKYLMLLQQYTEHKPAHGQDMYEKSLLHQLASYLYSDCFDGIHNDDTSSRHVSLVASLVQYINTNLAGDLSLENLARQVNYSEYYICRIFKNVTNYTLNNYIIEKRISRATQLLTTDMSITNAAEIAGFNNYSYFYKTFRKYTGSSPAEYKAAHLGGTSLRKESAVFS